MSTMFWIWLSVMVIAVILEIITTDLVSIWFAFGSLVPLIISAFDALNPIWQTTIFVVISAVLIASLRKVTLKWLFKNNNSKTNVDALIGQKYRLLEATDFETLGKIKIKDIDWSVVGEKQQTIEKDAIVEIVKIEGNKLIVKPAKEDNKADKKEK